MPRITKQIKASQQGMTPFLYGDGISRLEHFDLTCNQFRPFRALATSAMTGYDKPAKFSKANGKLYMLAGTIGMSRANILEWNQLTYVWEIYQSINANYSYAEVLHYYNGYFYGLRSGANLWKMKVGDVQDSFQVLTYSYYADPITHSKDGLMYIPTDNKISVCNGTTLTTGITFPTNYIITSIREDGDYIAVIGYDSTTYSGVGYLWDRDSSVATLTAKYDLGEENPYHIAVLGGTKFFISLRGGSSNSAFEELPTLVIKYISGDKVKTLPNGEFQFKSLNIGGDYVINDTLYFNATVVFKNETASHYVVFALNDSGNLWIAQNVGINDNAGNESSLPGVIRDGDAFWIGGRTDGAWHTSSNYGSDAIIETTKYRADNLTQSLDFVGSVVGSDPLPANASIVLKTMADGEASWTTIETFSDDGSINNSTNGNNLVDTAKNRQFRLECVGGAVINIAQFDLDTKNEQVYD